MAPGSSPLSEHKDARPEFDLAHGILSCPSNQERRMHVFARKIRVQVLSPAPERPCPIVWLDSYSMRSFTGRSAFDETLPVADGLLEASFSVDLEALRADMEDWMTRKFGEGQPVGLNLTEG
jgi:hypothetical protein